MIRRGMARKLKTEYPEALFHIMTKGNKKEPIF